MSTEDAAFLVLAQDNKVVKQNTELLLNYDPDTVLTLNSSKTIVNGKPFQMIFHQWSQYKGKFLLAIFLITFRNSD